MRAAGGVGSVVALVGLSLVSLALPVGSARQRFVVVGSIDEALGVMLIAFPDVEHQAAQAVSWLVKTTKAVWLASRAALRRRWLAMRRLRDRWIERTKNWYRRRRGHPQRFVRNISASVNLSSELAASAEREKGSLDDRVAAIEQRLSGLPEKWRADMSSLRDRRITLRWVGLPVLILGIVLTLVGNVA